MEDARKLQLMLAAALLVVGLVVAVSIAISANGTSANEDAGSGASNIPTLSPTFFVGTGAPTDGEASFTIIETFPHDTNAFTQGLLYHEGFLYESTGLRNNRSTLRKVVPETGEVVQQVYVDSVADVSLAFSSNSFFAEGLVKVEDKLLQLTWQSKVFFVYNFTTFELLDTVEFTTTDDQGWGITLDDRRNRLVVSDGSSYLHFWDPDTYEVLGQVRVVSADGRTVYQELNELEYIEGEIFANQWQTRNVLRIDAETGVVKEIIRFLDLPFTLNSGANVLNGIAYNYDERNLFMTGKLWSHMMVVNIPLLGDNSTGV